MRNNKDDDHASRRNSASDAKAALLEAHKTGKAAAETSRLAREEAKIPAAEARAERQAEKARMQLEEQQRIEAEAAAAEAAARAEDDAREQAEKDMVSRVVKDQAELKAERDRRYAARKAKKR